jgi:hypothetical protein
VGLEIRWALVIKSLGMRVSVYVGAILGLVGVTLLGISIYVGLLNFSVFLE